MAPVAFEDGLPTTGSSNPDLVCPPANWTNVALFFFVNYIAHCATVKPYPGETIMEISFAIAGALFLPSSGVSRALDAISRRTRFRRGNELDKAAIAGSLCMVVRNESWSPKAGEVIQNIRQPYEWEKKNLNATTSTTGSAVATESTSEHELAQQDSEEVELLRVSPHDLQPSEHSDDPSLHEGEPKKKVIVSFSMRSPPWMLDNSHRTSHKPRSIAKRRCKIHGVYSLPMGYEFAYVPSDAIVTPNIREGFEGERSLEIASSYSFTKAAIAIVQTVYASVSLYRSRGDQVQWYGYAAFGLTVIPYILMSVLNLIGQIVTADYPVLYMIHSAEMDEATGRGGVFDGVVGTLTLSKKTVQEKGIDITESCGPWEVGGRVVNGINYATLRNTSWDSPGNIAPHILKLETNEIATYRKVRKSGGRPIRKAVGTIWVPTCSKFTRQGRGDYAYRTWGWETARSPSRRTSRSPFLLFFAPVLVGGISLMINGILTKFRSGSRSTSVEKGFTMSWLIVGMLFGVLSTSMSKYLLHAKGVSSFIGRLLVFIITFGIFLVPTVGGFYVVGHMILEFGACTRID